jgi:transposase
MSKDPSRRDFLGVLAARTAGIVAGVSGIEAVATLLRPGHALAPPPPRPEEHPEPRPGVDASLVLTADDLAGAPHVIPVFDAVREIPHIADGLRCYCGCAELTGYRSLLSCYEGVGMARFCEICQGQALLAHNRWKEGQTLQQIRRATDARFGAGAPVAAAGRDHCALAG